MNSLSRVALVCLLALILPLQSLAGSLLTAPPCPDSASMAMLDDCCEQLEASVGGQLCADMAQCASTPLPLAAHSFKTTLVAACAPSARPPRAQPLSRPALAPWRPPRA